MAITNQKDDPPNPAELGYRVVSTLIGRGSPTGQSPADIRYKREHNSVVMKDVDSAGKANPLGKGILITLYIEREFPARDITIVTRKTDANGTVTLEQEDRDKVIASLIVQLPSGNVDLGRIDPPDTPPPKGDGDGDGGYPASKRAAKKSSGKKTPPQRQTQKSPQTAGKKPSRSTSQQTGE